MDNVKEDFIKMILNANALKWGSFVLKSGRPSPYFFNAGLLCDGDTLKTTGEAYAHILCNQIKNAGLDVNHLFGPAYKGLPLATATAVACAHHGINLPVSFNRKEAKAHGEGGQLIGAPLKGKRVAMIDDVITAGTAFRESKALIQEAGGTLSAVIITLDREERGPHDISTLQEIQAEGIAVFSIITLSDLMQYLEKNKQQDQVKSLKNYKAKYGA